MPQTVELRGASGTSARYQSYRMIISLFNVHLKVSIVQPLVSDLNGHVATYLRYVYNGGQNQQTAVILLALNNLYKTSVICLKIVVQLVDPMYTLAWP